MIEAKSWDHGFVCQESKRFLSQKISLTCKKFGVYFLFLTQSICYRTSMAFLRRNCSNSNWAIGLVMFKFDMKDS